MTEKNERPFEERQAELMDWFKKVGEMKPEDGDEMIPDIDKQLVKGMLVDLGANFEISEEAMKPLSQPTNKYRRPGLDAVWGKDKVDAFKAWIIEEFIPGCELRSGRELHTLYDSETQTYDNNNHSGMMQFFGELTSYASGKMTVEKYKSKSRVRITKGIKQEYGDVPKPYIPKGISSFPPEFPQAALNYLSDHKSDK